MLVQREVERGRSPLASITPFSAGRFRTTSLNAVAGGGTGACRNWFQERKTLWVVRARTARVGGRTNWLGKKIVTARTLLFAVGVCSVWSLSDMPIFIRNELHPPGLAVLSNGNYTPLLELLPTGRRPDSRERNRLQITSSVRVLRRADWSWRYRQHTSTSRSPASSRSRRVFQFRERAVSLGGPGSSASCRRRIDRCLRSRAFLPSAVRAYYRTFPSSTSYEFCLFNTELIQPSRFWRTSLRLVSFSISCRPPG